MLQQPSLPTLKRYGLSLEDWTKIAEAQNKACFVCEKVPTKGRLCIDHEHVKGWKKMPPDQRKLYVRGLLCWVCNHYYLGRGITIPKAANVVRYLELYETRKPK
jgi:hypothetical protein